MNDQTKTIVNVAGVAGALYLAHRWLSNDRRAEAADDEPAAPPTAPVRARPKPARPRGLDRQFDAVFASQGSGLPVAYLRALAGAESDLRADLADGRAWGLLQVQPIVLADYNRRHDTTFRRADLLSPAINVAIAADTLQLIAASYRRFHPEAVNLQEDWHNPRFVELLTFGWNAGFSERAGVGRVAGHLVASGIVDLTIDDVFAHARRVGASAHLSDPRKVAFAKSVTAAFQRERARDEAEGYRVKAAAVALDEPVSEPSQVDGGRA